MLESRPGQLVPLGNVARDGPALAAAEQQQRRILDKVWSTVERAMNEMRALLLRQLKDPVRSTDEHEKTIE